MNDKRIKILTPEEKRRKKDKVIIIVVLIILILLIAGLLWAFFANKDTSKHIVKVDDNTSTTTTTTVIHTTATNTTKATTTLAIRTNPTTNPPKQQVRKEFINNDNNISNQNTNSFIYNFELKDEKYNIYVCSTKNLSRISSFILYINNEYYDSSTNIYGLSVPKDDINLSSAPNIMIGIGNDKYQAIYNTECR